MTVPEIPAGTRVSLRPGEWASHMGQLGTIYMDVRVVKVGDMEGVPGWVWLLVHMPECHWESVACAREWCVKVAVWIPALYDAVNR
ncbi:hypothetical protein [Micromonospora sp. WMMD980]|uniref:hypothetical protein n=1 Tax=Micromonospora sp. WMMD980 TaxID=3016088 RepID=UPI0024179F63|nr:hypothetical protein [Micromonospora sp. WMMD980]MDG4798986.1 hypothetical protein [Micromonospora sp. WMMD980]MDG4799010.1 hypothetical protein [Micromonospora sp. WMMD980]MDG4799076.1 hypothetical protein [Micromonospora sp. WMMD980]